MLGGQDPKVSINESKLIFKYFRGERSFVVFLGLSHESYVSKEASKWEASVDTFLKNTSFDKE